MGQQITVIVMVDVQAALNAGKLDGNIYLIDNLRTDGSEGVGTGELITAVHGSYWSNGSQATEVIINWLTSAIGSLPPTLPRNFHVQRTKSINADLLHSIRSAFTNSDAEAGGPPVQDLVNKVTGTTFIEDTSGKIRRFGTKPLTVTGDYFEQHEDDPSSLSYLAPSITNITGEAVDQGIIFPCQQGTPVYIKDGWYWCAAANTSEEGIYSYTMHINLYKLVNNVYEPVKMTYDAKIKVSTGPQRNGFTNAGIGFIPL